MSSLTHSKSEKINHFKTVTNIQSDDIAQYALQKTNWDVTNCIRLYFENADALLNDAQHVRDSAPSETQTNTLLEDSPSLVQYYASYIPGLSSLGSLFTSLLSYLRPYLAYFMNIFSSMFGNTSSMSYSEILREFIQSNQTFESNANCTVFCDLSFGEVMKSTKCLFIYFNDKSSAACANFNKNILSNNSVIAYLRVNMDCWIGDDRNNAGKQLFRQITYGWHERRRPFVCIAGIHPHSKKLVLVHRQYVGNSTSAMLFIANVLDHGLQRWQHFKNQQIQRQMLSQSNRDLREMQDREYMRALQQEQEKEKEEEEEEEQKQNETEKEKEHDAGKWQRRMQIANKKINALSLMIDESQTNKVRVALRLPNGKRVEHMFCDGNCVESLFDFALCHELKIDDEYIDDFELVCSYHLTTKDYKYNSIDEFFLVS
eukprot:195990_1